MRYLIILLLATTCISTSGQVADTIKLYFDLGSATLSPNQQYYLDSLSYNNNLKVRTRYSVIGYCDMVGSEKLNYQLSGKRAIVVANYLNNLGITEIDTVIGKGKVDRPEAQDGYPTDRRVDIVTAGITKKYDISKLKKNDVFDLENMIFHGGLSTMKEESLPVLKELLSIMTSNPQLKIRVEGHVHCFVTTGHNDGQVVDHNHNLATLRAKVVYDYLIKNDIEEKRLEYKGRACQELKFHPENNRRVSVRILDK